MSTSTESSHWVWGSWWRRLLRKRTYYYAFRPEAGVKFMKFDEYDKKWHRVDAGEFEDTLNEITP